MKNQTTPASLIPLFQAVEKHLHNNKLEFALSDVHSILLCDPKNLYAIALDRRLKRVLDLQQKPPVASNASEYSHARLIAALEHVCHLAVQHLMNLSAKAPIRDMSRQLRDQALENKYQALLHRGRQHLHIQEYERALQEAERARIIKPHGAEADSLILEIKAHTATSAKIEKHQIQLEDAAKNRTVKAKQTRDAKTNTNIERPEAVTEKILSSISFADYYRTNGDYAVCLRYIEQGLILDNSNDVLLQMKQEVEKTIMEKKPEIKTSFQFV
jgi:hypothetical protein